MVIGGFFADGAAPGSGSNGNLGIFDECIDGACEAKGCFLIASDTPDAAGELKLAFVALSLVLLAGTLMLLALFGSRS